MNKKTYTDKISITTDLKLYLAWRNGTSLNLSMLPKLCADRWTWILQNWDRVFYSQFLNQANGDEYLTVVLETLSNHVTSWRNGSNVNPFRNMEIFADAQEFLEQISVDLLVPTQLEVQYIQEEIKRVSEFQVSNFQSMLSYLKTQRDVAFDFIGLSDSTYDTYAGRTASPKQRDYFISDLEQLSDAIELEKFIQGIILEFKFQKQVEPDLLAFANSQLEAGSSEVRAEDIYSSYFSVPFEQSLEQMAQDYLGNKDKWYELVTINKLKPPYIDIYGTKTLLTENASSNAIRVSSVGQEKFRVGATVKIGSRIVPEEVRKVEQYIDNQDGSISVFLSGKQDLSKLRTEHLAYMRIYIPETINDFTFVKIPLIPVSPYLNTPEPSRSDLKQLDKALYAFGVDIAKDDRTGDIVIDTSGDFKIQFGIKNVRQALFSIIRTGIGELPLHPEYGLPNTTGFAMQGAETAVKISTIIEKAVSRDPRFTAVNISNITISAEGTINLSMAVSIAGSNELIPLAFVI